MNVCSSSLAGHNNYCCLIKQFSVNSNGWFHFGILFILFMINHLSTIRFLQYSNNGVTEHVCKIFFVIKIHVHLQSSKEGRLQKRLEPQSVLLVLRIQNMNLYVIRFNALLIVERRTVKFWLYNNTFQVRKLLHNQKFRRI